jgi:hypothetical protein
LQRIVHTDHNTISLPFPKSYAYVLTCSVGPVLINRLVAILAVENGCHKEEWNEGHQEDGCLAQWDSCSQHAQFQQEINYNALPTSRWQIYVKSKRHFIMSSMKCSIKQQLHKYFDGRIIWGKRALLMNSTREGTPVSRPNCFRGPNPVTFSPMTAARNPSCAVRPAGAPEIRYNKKIWEIIRIFGAPLWGGVKLMQESRGMDE